MVVDRRMDSSGKMVFDPKGKLPKGSSTFQQVLEEIAHENDPKPDENGNETEGQGIPKSKTKTPRISGSRWHIARAKMNMSRKPAMYKVVMAATTRMK